ncbi:MAG: DUF5320 domain-containing protein [Methanosarcina sp.]|uniref:DUF5320 domain-containing protein n=1 Tax=Methanosarcina sp. TaxID=2213 RepID=UPI002614C54C|nr:DUF5320 domain-containing protein [Methanosarcina sp.]MDD3248257.1 DUF5320 domain-containing protein [Methanosarcina sp.]MDD4250027.1 DUF5320 domain-containing protein [Methanosarcina sp.]
MPNGNRTGPMGPGSKTGRRFGEHNSGGRKSGSGGGRGMGCARKDRGFRCRSAPAFVNSEESAVRDTSPGYYYSAPSQPQTWSETDFLENKRNLLKEELKTLSWKFKALLPQGSNVEK